MKIRKILATISILLIAPLVVCAEAPNSVSTPALSLENNKIKIVWDDGPVANTTPIDYYNIYIDDHAIGDAEEYTEKQKTDGKLPATPAVTATTPATPAVTATTPATPAVTATTPATPAVTATTPATPAVTATTPAPDNKKQYFIERFKGVNLVEGKTYFVSITAVNKQGEESLNYSNEASIIYLKEVESATNTSVTTPSTTPATTDANKLQVAKAEAVFNNLIAITFNKEVVLPANPNDAFVIKTKTGDLLKIQQVTLGADKKRVEIKTDNQIKDIEYTVTALSSVTDVQGAPLVSGITDSANFVGTDLVETTHASGTVSTEVDATKVPPATTATTEPTAEELAAIEKAVVTVETTKLKTDLLKAQELVNKLTNETVKAPYLSRLNLIAQKIAPEDVTNLKAGYKYNDEKENFNVNLNWTPSIDSDKDLVNYNYYQKESEGNYTTAVLVAKDKTMYQTELAGGKRYTFKISTVDNVGNESTGAITSIILPETGPALILGLAGLLSASATGFIRRRKNKN